MRTSDFVRVVTGVSKLAARMDSQQVFAMLAILTKAANAVQAREEVEKLLELHEMFPAPMFKVASLTKAEAVKRYLRVNPEVSAEEARAVIDFHKQARM